MLECCLEDVFRSSSIDFFQAIICILSVIWFFWYHVRSGQGGQSGQISSHLSHQVNRGLSLRRTGWCHLSLEINKNKWI